MPRKNKNAHADYCPIPLDDKHTRCPPRVTVEADARLRHALEQVHGEIEDTDETIAEMCHVGANPEQEHKLRRKLVRHRADLMRATGARLEPGEDGGELEFVYPDAVADALAMIDPRPLETIRAIAGRVLGVETLETQRSDRLDFHSLAVWSIRAALLEAYRAGQDAK